MPRGVNARKKTSKPPATQKIPVTDEIRIAQIRQLILAIQENRASDIPHIIAAGADVSFVLDNDVSALHLAVAYNHFECIAPLLHAGANVNAKTSQGHTPLHLAAENSYLDSMLALIKAKADLTAADLDGDAAIHFATRNGNVACVHELLKAGADIEVKNNKAISPFTLAAHLNYPELIREFALHGCVRAQQALARTEEATNIKQSDSLGSKIAGFFSKASWMIGKSIPQRVKNVSYVLGQLSIGFAVPYLLDVPMPIMATSVLISSYLITKRHLSYTRSLKKGVIPETKDEEPIEMDPLLVNFALTYAQSLADKLDLGKINVIFDRTQSNRHNAAAFPLADSIFINQELVKKTRSLHKLQAVIAHEMQHLNINKHCLSKGLRLANKFFQEVTKHAVTADFLSKVVVELSPFRIPYLTDLMASRLLYSKEQIGIQLLGHFLETQMARDEEFNADSGAVASANDTSMDLFLTDTLLCAKARELAKLENAKEPSSVWESAWYHNGWETKKPIPYLYGLFSKRHPPIVDRLKNLQERRAELKPR